MKILTMSFRHTYRYFQALIQTRPSGSLPGMLVVRFTDFWGGRAEDA